MRCPSCQSHQLYPAKLDVGLSGRVCNKCHGTLIDLLYYREWAETLSSKPPEVAHKLDEVEDSSKALNCPKCSRIMLKFRVSDNTSNKIDVCSHCDEAWLDNGEWELLGLLALQDKLTKIFTEPWQQSIKNEEYEKSDKQRFIELLGEEGFNKLTVTRDWIDKHPNKSDLIRFLLRD